MLRISVVAVIAVAVFSCGPKSDLAQSRGELVTGQPLKKPNVMVLLDNSGSMLLPLDPAAPACPAGCGTSASQLCPASCPTRSSEARQALSDFFDVSANSARVGLAVFPSDNVCGSASTADVALPPEGEDVDQLALLENNATRAKSVVMSKVPTGGTPTAASLEFVHQLSSMRDPADGREDWVVLITDGLPNCSDTNPHQLCSTASPSAAQLMACACTTSTCASTLCAKGCLDDEGTLATVEALRTDGIRTMVMGFGPEVAGGMAQTVYGSLAQAGGFTRRRSDGTVESPYLHSADGSQLSVALTSVLAETSAPPCTWSLSRMPGEGQTLGVFVNGARATAAGIDTARARVTFDASVCAAKASVDFRIE